MSYDNTAQLGASTWRHVAFIEKPLDVPTTDLGLPGMGPPAPASEDQGAASGDSGVRWLMSSDVCKHCTHAACLDVCPTGALFRTEFGTVVVQPDVCNGCGYCVPACPYGVIDQRKEDGRVFKCTLCYDRLKEGQTAGVRAGLPDRVDPVRRALRAAPAGRQPGRGAAREGRRRGPALRRRPRRRRRRRRRVLPAARRARGLRPAARPGRDHARPRLDVAPRRRGGRRPGGARRRRVRREAADEGAPHGRRAAVRVLLRPADPQGADLEDAGRAAVPLPRRARPAARRSWPRARRSRTCRPWSG